MRYACVALVFVLIPQMASAQGAGERFDVSGHVAVVNSGEFDATDVGVGVRLGWRSAPWAGVEAELTFYPDDFADDRAPFSSSRIEGLFGVTLGPRLGRVRPFARVRPGFVAFREPEEPLACILIFPPPLACTLAAGQTLFALDIGGGLEISVTPRTFLRFDIGDRAVRYTSPVIGPADEVLDDAFFGHDVRMAIGAGVRF